MEVMKPAPERMDSDLTGAGAKWKPATRIKIKHVPCKAAQSAPNEKTGALAPVFSGLATDY
jgi:hypothetical protein